MQWCYPYGVVTPASWMALNATRYMHTFGVTSEDFGRAVVQLRAYAATNPNAHFYGVPIDLEDHQSSRWIAEPCIRLFDCCQETDGSVALVITAADRAGDTRAPIVIETAAGAGLFEQEIASDHYRADLSVMEGSVALAHQLFDNSGVSRDDIDVALIYDAFSPILLMQLEALGFCGPGEASDFIAEGNIGRGGRLPVNTNGGLLGEGYIHGMNNILEAVRQVRGTAPNQVDGVEHVLISAGRSGLVLGRQ
jgi:acetyl-CoA acetyltransferase